MNGSSLSVILFLISVLIQCKVESFAIKTHLEASSINKSSNNDTLVFAHIVSKTVDKKIILICFEKKNYDFECFIEFSFKDIQTWRSELGS